MKRTLILLFLSFHFLIGFSQVIEEADTNFYTPMFDRDTNARVHVGVRLGAHMQGISFVLNDQFIYKDSISNWSSENQLGFSFGLLLNAKLTPHWNLESGINVLISQIKLYAEVDGERLERSTNYSTIQLPAWVNYAPKVKSNRMYFGGGAIFTADISKIEDKINRVVQLSPLNIMVGVGMGYRMQLPSKANVNFDLQLHYGLINMVSKDDNFYNNAMKQVNLWEVSFYVSIN